MAGMIFHGLYETFTSFMSSYYVTNDHTVFVSEKDVQIACELGKKRPLYTVVLFKHRYGEYPWTQRFDMTTYPI